MEAPPNGSNDALKIGIYAEYLWDIKRDMNKSKAEFERALALDANDTWVRSMYAQCLSEMNMNENQQEIIENHYKFILKDDPLHPMALGNYGVFMYKIPAKRRPAMVITERHVAKYPDHASIVTKLGNMHKGYKNDYEKAIELYSLALSKNPSHPEALACISLLQHASGASLDQTSKSYQAAFKENNLNPNFLSNYALFLTDVEKNHGKAEFVYRRALTINPRHISTLYNYGVLLDVVFGKYEEALEYYEEVIKTDPSHSHAWHNLAIILQNRCETNNAAATIHADETFKLALEANPNDTRTMAEYGNFLLRIVKDKFNAEAWLTKALEASENRDPTALLNMGKLKESSKHYDDAKSMYELCLQVEPNHMDAIAALAHLLGFHLNATDDAERLYQRLLEMDPTNIENLLHYANFVNMTNGQNVDKAKRCLVEAYRMAPSDPKVACQYATWLFRREDNQHDAIEILRPVIGRNGPFVKQCEILLDEIVNNNNNTKNEQ